MIPTAPLRLRNRLAEIILHALHDARSLTLLRRLGEDSAALDGWVGSEDAAHAAIVRLRVERALSALGVRPPLGAEASLHETLAAAAALFDAGLHFEVHELLEPYWTRAAGRERQVLQGLIQIAVGYQHLANGNLAGARALLAEGADRIRDGGLPGLDLQGFAGAVTATLARLSALGEGDVPRFPTKSALGRETIAQ